MKSEKEKMLSGEYYKSFEQELFEMRQTAKDLLFEFNNLSPRKVEERNEIIKKLLGKTGNKFYFEPRNNFV